MRATKLIAYSMSSTSSVSGSSGGRRKGWSMCRCQGIHTSGMVERVRRGRKLSGSVSSSSTRERASMTSSVKGVVDEQPLHLVAEDVLVVAVLPVDAHGRLVEEQRLEPIVDGHEAEDVGALLHGARVAVGGAVPHVEAAHLRAGGAGDGGGLASWSRSPSPRAPAPRRAPRPGGSPRGSRARGASSRRGRRRGSTARGSEQTITPFRLLVPRRVRSISTSSSPKTSRS